MSKDPKMVKQGKKNAVHGAEFEKRVRKDLEEKGWIVDRWTNNVSDYPDSNINLPTEERVDRKIIQAQPHMVFNPMIKRMVPLKRNTGFPDFMAYRKMACSLCYARMGRDSGKYYKVIGVECKMTGKLDRAEKDKCNWYLDNKIFNAIFIAEKTKVKNRVVIVYKEYVREVQE